MPATDPRYFLCTGECVKYADLHLYPGSHVVGRLGYLTDEGRRVSALARWEVSVLANTVPPLAPQVDAWLVGDVRNVQCRFPGCERRYRWEIGLAAFQVLMARYPRSRDG